MPVIKHCIFILSSLTSTIIYSAVFCLTLKATTKLVEFIVVTSLYVGNQLRMLNEPRLPALLVYQSYLVVFCYGAWRKYNQLQPDSLLVSMKSPSSTHPHLNDVCSICHDTMESSASCVTTCDHVFHRTCLTMWLNVSLSCPSCRHEF